MTIEVGEKAPDFRLRAQDRTPVTNDDLRGRRALVVFMPFAFTSTCQGEMCVLRDGLARLADLDAAVVVITCDTRHVNARWSEQNGFTFPVLSDFWPHGEVTRAFGAFNEQYGAANRRTVVLDEEGIIRRIIESDALDSPREFDEYTAALEGLAAES